MTANQAYQFVNAVASEAIGSAAVTVRDTSSLVSLGDQVLSSSTNKEAFYQKLMDRVGYVYVKAKMYATTYKDGLMMTPLDFGAALQKVQTKSLCQATENTSWTNQVNPFAKAKDTTDIEQRIFSKLSVWQTDTKVIYDHQLNTAFVNAANMSAFVNLIYTDMKNAMEFQLEQVSKTARATGIANVIESTKATVKRNLYAEYLALHTDSTLTVADCMEDVDFLKYASAQINLAAKRIAEMSTLFNPSNGYTRFTKKEDMIIDVLAEADSKFNSYLQADTYHNTMTALPNGYNIVNCWQSSGTDYSFENASSIKIKLDGKESATEQSGIIATIRDKESLGMMFDRLKIVNAYNPFSECDNVAYKAEVGYYCDPTENFIVFYIDEVTD